MSNCNAISTPIEVNYKVSGDVDPGLQPREIIGKLAFFSNCTRPDIMYAVICLSRFLNWPTKDMLAAIKRMLRYLRGTIDLCLVFCSMEEERLIIYADSDFAGDTSDCKSTMGILVKLHGDTINWCSKKQDGVVMSTAEAEYVTLIHAVIEAKIWRNLLENFVQLSVTPIFTDSSSAKSIAETGETETDAPHRRSLSQYKRSPEKSSRSPGENQWERLACGYLYQAAAERVV